jgi:CheY-like chemotaxis protein
MHFSVTDTGVGIPLEKQQLIFEPLAQADNTASHGVVGAGLGLAISQKLVALMGGHIWVESQVGRGSTFHFVVPFAVRPAIEHLAEGESAGRGDLASPQVPTTLLGGRLRILLAEDNPINRHLAITLLEEAGHSVVAVSDGAQALAALERERFDLMLMDVQMPELDGFAATAALRARERSSGAHIPVIAMTARAMHSDRERCLAAGMDSYISKPLDIETFAQAVATLVPAAAAPSSIPQLVKEHESPVHLPACESDIGGGSKPIFDHDRLRAQTLGKPDLLAKVIGLFLADYPQQLSKIRAAAADGECRASGGCDPLAARRAAQPGHGRRTYNRVDDRSACAPGRPGSCYGYVRRA